MENKDLKFELKRLKIDREVLYREYRKKKENLNKRIKDLTDKLFI